MSAENTTKYWNRTMKIAEKPKNETERLKKLRSLQILDTDTEERFERITRLVCHTLDVPICAISLVDQDRNGLNQFKGWMRSKHRGTLRSVPMLF